MLSGIGQGSSFPSLSNATGRPAMDGSFTVEMTGKDCCPATNGALKRTAINTLANPVDFIFSFRSAYDASLLSFGSV